MLAIFGAKIFSPSFRRLQQRHRKSIQMFSFSSTRNSFFSAHWPISKFFLIDGSFHIKFDRTVQRLAGQRIAISLSDAPLCFSLGDYYRRSDGRFIDYPRDPLRHGGGFDRRLAAAWHSQRVCTADPTDTERADYLAYAGVFHSRR